MRAELTPGISQTLEEKIHALVQSGHSAEAQPLIDELNKQASEAQQTGSYTFTAATRPRAPKSEIEAQQPFTGKVNYSEWHPNP